jgi:hypothetical protein
VSIVAALDGKPVVPVAPVAAVVPVMALESCEENDIDAPAVPLELVLAAVLADGVNAVDRLESSELIMATRAVISEMLIFYSGSSTPEAANLNREGRTEVRPSPTVPSMDRI